MDCISLIDIATQLGFSDLIAKLQAILERQNKDDAPLTLPLVGEFSSGKTTLINSLTNSHQLETATKPTTATIYQIHFGCERCYAVAYGANGEMKEFDEISLLKNNELADSNIIDVYDTSIKINPSVILVDTPGLSSPDSKHKQALVDFLPYADGVLLVSDINQQLTRSVTDFVKTISLSRRPIYLVLTKCDTKSPSGITEAIDYIKKNSEVKFERIVTVSANDNNTDNFCSLLSDVQKDKNRILKEVDEQRVKDITNEMLQRIELLLESSKEDKTADDSVNYKEIELSKLKRTLERIFTSVREHMDEESRKIQRRFDDEIFTRLETVVVSKSANFDADAISAINNLSSILINEYRSTIKSCLQKISAKYCGEDNMFNIDGLSGFDISKYNIGGLSYNLNLNEEGHQYDGWIATGTKVVAAVATVAAVASTGGAVAAASAMTLDTAADIADTVTDVGSMMSNRKTASRIERAADFIQCTNNKMTTIDQANAEYGQRVGSSKGLVESMVGFITDKTLGKPQRRKAIHSYIDCTLLPNFKEQLSIMSTSLLFDIEKFIQEQAEEKISETNAALEELKRLKKEQHAAFMEKMDALRDFKNKILTL
jgi:elongation factor Tu GTP binding domain